MSHCEHCPASGTGRGCPCWVGPETGTIILETNVATGEERPISGCFYQVMPRLMVEVIKASNRPAAAIESTRNELVVGLARLAGVMPRLLPGGPPIGIDAGAPTGSLQAEIAEQ